MEKTVRTAVGALLQTAQKLNLPYNFADNSIMNKQLGFLPDDLPSSTPWSRFVAIGIGGMGVRYYDNNETVEMWPQPHEPQHTGMYKQIPFVMRPVTEDLTTVERSRFYGRTIEQVDGIQYACYWLRPLDLRETVARMEYRQIIDGQVTSTPWQPSYADQHPIPKILNPGQVLVTGDDYIASTAKSTFQFNPWDMTELVNVGQVKFKSDTRITLTEMAVCSGGIVETTGNFDGIQLPYNEAIGVQITDFVSTFIPAAFNRAGAAINLDIGSVEPLLALRSSNGISAP